tara:strand:- start:767 stop:970 length:204 start_codon:yes stop_codon:yes gene_type:complete
VVAVVVDLNFVQVEMAELVAVEMVEDTLHLQIQVQMEPQIQVVVLVVLEDQDLVLVQCQVLAVAQES